jgi:polysaccharide deacetylase family protein (PEP-CTERM system associated)
MTRALGFDVIPAQVPARRLFTVDVEEWFHSNFSSAPVLDTGNLPLRAEVGVERLLDALAEADSRATFFFLGEVATTQPGLVRRVASAGHEIACHSFHHTLLYEQSRAEVARDLGRARSALSDLSGQPVDGFRAPSWSITTRNLWALDALVEAGFRYDSSIFPAKNYLYGIDGAPKVPYRLRTREGNELLEIPPPTVGLGPLRFGVGGGFYLRVLPLWVHRAAMRATLDSGVPFLMYLHPREFDPESWKLVLPLDAKERLIHTFGLARGAGRARALLEEGPWHAMSSLLDRGAD